jgi:pimeloyl-ACP methyl ester carboxylesterase
MISTSIIHNLATREAVLGDNGDVVLMLHGWGANLDLMLPLGERLANLNYRVYIPDLPGFGETQPPPVSWSVGDYVAFVLAYLDYHKLERVHLFGHSFGGRLSLVLGAEHSHRIGKIVLSNSAGIRPKTPLMGQTRLNSYKTIRDGLRGIGLNTLSDRLQAWYTGRYGSADYKSASGVMRETFVKVVGEDLLPYAARMKPSTLLLWGNKDEDTPLWQGKLLEQTIPDAGLVVYEGAGHYAYLERLADAVRVTDFFYKQG